MIMARGVLSFDLPEEESAFENAFYGTAWRAALQDVDNWLRDKLKYGHDYKSVDDALEAARAHLYQALSARGLFLYE